MKNNFLLIGLLATLLAACNKNDEEGVFDQSPDERLNATLQEYQSILESAPYGWRGMIVPTGAADKHFYFWFRFMQDNRVTMKNDLLLPQQSSYRLKALQRPELIFDTYSYLHMLADEGALITGAVPGKGLSSDFEFEIVSASPDSVILEGKYNGSPAVLWKAAATDSVSFVNEISRKDPAAVMFVNYEIHFKRTLYAGKVSNGIITAVAERSGTLSVIVTEGGTHILIPYADLTDWNISIRIDPAANKVISVTPDAAMVAGIAPNSFRVLGTSFDPVSKVLYLKTGYTNTTGNERIMEEVLTWK